jgi:hypothetical protein
MTASVDIEAHGIRAPAADPCSDKQLASRPRSDAAGASASAMVPQCTSRLRSSAEGNREKMLAAAFSWTTLRRLARRLWLRTPLGRTQAEHQRVLARLKSHCSQDVRPRPQCTRQSTQIGVSDTGSQTYVPPSAWRSAERRPGSA